MQRQRDLIVVGGSAGGLPAVETILRTLPPELPMAILLVLHTSPDHPSRLVEVLNRRSVYQVSYARDQEDIRTGMCMWHRRTCISRLSMAISR